MVQTKNITRRYSRRQAAMRPSSAELDRYAAETGVEMNPTEMRSLVDHYIDAYNRMDVDAMLEGVHPLVEFKNISAGVVNASTSGVAELKTLAQKVLPLFTERRQDIKSFEVKGSLAVASIPFRAVAASDMPNGLKKGQVLNLSGRSEFEFQDGKISKITDIS